MTRTNYLVKVPPEDGRRVGDQRRQRWRADRGRARTSGSRRSGEGRARRGRRCARRRRAEDEGDHRDSHLVRRHARSTWPFRFEWRFGVAAIVATAHDILTTMAFLAMMHLEVSLTVVAALLTVIGYSLNDTIIIFDRVRENLKKQRKESLRDVLNRSINETLPRSVLTHATVFAATLSLLIFAGEVIRPFSWIMAFGVFTGTFSSIYVAGPILLWIEHKWPRARAPRARERRARSPKSGAANSAIPSVLADLSTLARRTAALRGGSRYQ